MRGYWLYRAYGLTLRSTIELKSLEETGQTGGVVDVEVHVHESNVPLPRADLRISWDGVCELSASSGTRLDVYPHPHAVADDLELAIVGAGLALALEQRGRVVLHGSCVEIDGAAISLIGPSGAGKSTIATAIAAAGNALVSDGMTVLDLSTPGDVWALRGPPLVKLLPDAARRLGLRPEELPLVHSSSPKVRATALTRASEPMARLCAVLVLSAGNSPGVAPMAASASAFALVKNFFLIDEMGAARGPSILRACSELARRVPCQSLRRATLDDLPGVVDVVVGVARRLRS